MLKWFWGSQVLKINRLCQVISGGAIKSILANSPQHFIINLPLFYLIDIDNAKEENNQSSIPEMV